MLIRHIPHAPQRYCLGSNRIHPSKIDLYSFSSPLLADFELTSTGECGIEEGQQTTDRKPDPLEFEAMSEPL